MQPSYSNQDYERLYKNSEIISKFPKDNEKALISETKGTLTRLDGTAAYKLTSTSSLVSNLQPMVKAIKETFAFTKHEFEKTKEQVEKKNQNQNEIEEDDFEVIEINYLENLEERYREETEMLNGLKNIARVYKKQFDHNKEAKEGLRGLELLVKTYEQTISKHREQIEQLKPIEVLQSLISDDPLTSVITLGEQVLKNPEKAVNQYLVCGAKLQFSGAPPFSSVAVRDFLNGLSLERKEYSTNQLLAIEAFATIALYSYIVNPQNKIDPDFNRIIDLLHSLRTDAGELINEKDNANIMRGLDQNQGFKDEEEFRTMKKNQEFYQFMKKKIEETPNYPKNFWEDPQFEKMKIPGSVLHLIGSKIANPSIEHLEGAELVHEDPGIGYQVYFLPQESGKPKLLLFFGENHSYSILPKMNHQIGLYGDQNILKSAEQIVSNIVSKDTLEGYLPDLQEGNIEIVAAGFDSSGSAATAVASKLALLYPKTNVLSIAAASTPFVTTEDAYNMNKAGNFLPIRLKYAADKNVDRFQNITGDFSNDSYNTFPLIVRYNLGSVDVYKHNKEEYGNIDNFVPAVKNPGLLRDIHDQLTHYIDYGDQTISGINESQLVAFNALEKIASEVPSNIGDYRDHFLVFENGKFSVKKTPLNLTEQENTIAALKQITNLLKRDEIITLFSAERAFRLLITMDTMLLNFNRGRVNMCLGKTPQMIDLISEIRTIAKNQLKATDSNKVINQNRGLLEYLASRAKDENYTDQIERENLLDKVDYEERFLEYLGFKIALKDQDKVGSEAFVANLHKDNVKNYDISLYTPEDPRKKQKIVINCRGFDVLGGHSLDVGLFGAGDIGIIKRADILSKDITEQLKKQFNKHKFDANDVDIVLTGFGAEGAVATAAGLYLAKHYPESQVTSFGFGAPRFTTHEGAQQILNQENFTPIRFLSSDDANYEFKFFSLLDYPLSNKTYHTIPFHFRIVEVSEKLKSHYPNLYGDVQALKTSMKNGLLMHEIAKEEVPQMEVDLEPAKRVAVDTRHEMLVDYSKKSIDDLQKVEPGKLIRIMKYCVELSENESIKDSDTKLIRKFFDNFITAIYNKDINANHSIKNSFTKKMINHGYRPNLLFGGKWKLQEIISDDLKNAIIEFQKADRDANPKELAELKLAIDYYRGLLAGDLNGNRYKPAGGGVNGAVFFKHLESGSNALLPWETEDKPYIGVFKPHPLTVREFKGWFDARQFGERLKDIAGMASHLNKDPDNRIHNEVFAYELFHLFGFDRHVGFPTTMKVTNKNDKEQRPAVFCEFLTGYDLVKSHVSMLNDTKKRYTDVQLTNWQLSKIADFLMDNMDGHEGNAFITEDLLRTANFDYDKAFPNERTKDIKNKFMWGKLAISERDFTKQTREIVRQMFSGPDTEKNLNAFLEFARREGKDNFTQAQENLLLDRIGHLKGIASGEIKNLSELAALK